MTIKLNEAPNSVLTALSLHALKRGCCTMSAILCYLPTFSSSASSCHETTCFADTGSGCCYMGCLSPTEEGRLTGLKEGLENIILAGNLRVKNGENATAVALDQTTSTIRLIENIAIKGSYGAVLTDIKAELTERLRIHTLTMPLLGSEGVQTDIFEQPARVNAAAQNGVTPSAPPAYEFKH